MDNSGYSKEAEANTYNYGQASHTPADMEGVPNYRQYPAAAPSSRSAYANYGNSSYTKSNTAMTQPVPVTALEDSTQCGLNQKNKPQSNSAGSVALVFLSGGMNMAWSLGYFYPTSHFPISKHMYACWFIGAIAGAIISAVLTNRLSTKVTYMISGTLVTIGGIVLIAASDSFAAVMTSRYLDGIANGMAMVPMFVLVGEEAVKNIRGILASTIEAWCLSIGMFIQIIYSVTWPDETVYYTGYNVMQMQGTLSTTYGLLAVIIGFFLYVESPVLLLWQNKEEQAIEALRRLQRPFVVTPQTYHIVHAHKEYIAMNKAMSAVESICAGLLPLLKLCLLRSFNSLSICFIVNGLLIHAATLLANGPPVWAPIASSLCRFVGILIAAFTIDYVGRKKLIVIGLFVSGALAIGLAVLSTSSLDFVNHKTNSVQIVILMLIYQFFAGLFVPSSSAYLTEAFPYRVKPYFIAIAVIVEWLVQIIVICCNVTIFDIHVFFYVLMALSLVSSVLAYYCLPETKKTTLKEAQIRFQKLTYAKFD